MKSRFACVAALVPLLLVTACATSDQAWPRAEIGAPCDQPTSFTASEDGKFLICLEPAQRQPGEALHAVWSLAALGRPVTDKATKDGTCAHVGDIARTADGVLVVCAFSPPDAASGKTEGNRP